MSSNCDVSLQLLCDICLTLYYWWKRTKVTRRNSIWGGRGRQQQSHAAYALGLTPSLDHLQSVKRSVKHAAFVDDLTGAGKLKEVKIWWDTLIAEGPKYYAEGPKGNVLYQLSGGHICSDVERASLALPVKFGDLRIQNLWEVANTELLNSKEITRELYENFITQNKDFQIDIQKTKTIKNELKRRKISNYKIKLEELRNSINKKMKRCNNISNKTGSSNWLSVIPMREFQLRIEIKTILGVRQISIWLAYSRFDG